MSMQLVARRRNIRKKYGEANGVAHEHIRIYERVKATEYIDHPLFKMDEAKHLLSYDLASDDKAVMHKPMKHGDEDDMRTYSKSLAQYGVLRTHAEQKLFLKYNYIKFLIKNHGPLDTEKDFIHVKQLLDLAQATRDIIICHNLRLVLLIVKDFRTDMMNSFDDHLSRGNESLMRAVEKFNVSRGYKFSTYAVYSIKMNHWKSRKKRMKDIPYTTSIGADFAEQNAPERTYECGQEKAALNDSINVVLDAMNENLTPREITILTKRFGLGTDKTYYLAELGQEVGCTRERVRQIQNGALDKLRMILNHSDFN